MLPLYIPGAEVFLPETNEFKTLPAQQLQLEHSLISLSKWEAKWKKSFLYAREMTVEQLLSYVKCMTINKVADESVYTRLSVDDIKKVRDYIDDPMSATTLPKSNGRARTRIITSEQIYGWMVMFGIPFDPCEKWHLNRLMMLIQVCGLQQSPSKKTSMKDRMAAQNAHYNRMHKKAGKR